MSLTIVAGKLYKTRGGARAFVSGISPFLNTLADRQVIGWVEGLGGSPTSSTSWIQGGSVWSSHECDDDIVAELLPKWDECGLNPPASPEALRPPLGLMPRKLWVEQRAKALMEACTTYLEVGKAIPDGWLEELSDHLWERTETIVAQNAEPAPPPAKLITRAQFWDAVLAVKVKRPGHADVNLLAWCPDGVEGSPIHDLAGNLGLLEGP